MSPQLVIWLAIALIGAVDAVLLVAQGMTITSRWGALGLIALLWSSSVLFQRRNPAIARLAGALAQIFAFVSAGSILTYVAMAASPFQLADAKLAGADAALGFDWPAWFAWIKAHPSVQSVLGFAYASPRMQIILFIVVFCYKDPKRVDALLLAGIISVAIVTSIMVVLPAVGAWSQHGVGIEAWRSDILALRSHALVTIGLTKGIISFPSFHTVLGVLLAYSARGEKWFVPVLCLNLLMIASVMTEGAHYAVDMLGGLAVAFVAIIATRSILAWAARPRAVELLPSLAVG